MRVNVIARSNSVGLERDQRILARHLEALGCEVTISDVQHRTRFFARGGAPVYDVNLFCQHFHPLWLKAAKINCLIPNQELVPQELRQHLSDFDWIVCKSRYAEKIFNFLGHPTFFLGFTSEDRYLEAVSKTDRFCLHIAGKSPFKGTDSVINAWRARPDFPELILLDRTLRRDPELPNVRFISKEVEDSLLQQWQNSALLHLCPSEAEGFGHYIVEALSVKALVISTDAPPMNELVSHQSGMLCPYATTTLFGLGESAHVHPVQLGASVEAALQLGVDGSLPLRENARRFYLENERAFQVRLRELVETLKKSGL